MQCKSLWERSCDLTQNEEVPGFQYNVGELAMLVSYWKSCSGALSSIQWNAQFASLNLAFYQGQEAFVFFYREQSYHPEMVLR